MVNQFSDRARCPGFPVDVRAELFANLHGSLSGWKLLHVAYFLFPVGLSVTVAEHPNVWASLPFFEVQATLLIPSAH